MSDLVRNPEDRFSHNEAQLVLVVFDTGKAQTSLCSYRSLLDIKKTRPCNNILRFFKAVENDNFQMKK